MRKELGEYRKMIGELQMKNEILKNLSIIGEVETGEYSWLFEAERDYAVVAVCEKP